MFYHYTLWIICRTLPRFVSKRFIVSLTLGQIESCRRWMSNISFQSCESWEWKLSAKPSCSHEIPKNSILRDGSSSGYMEASKVEITFLRVQSKLSQLEFGLMISFFCFISASMGKTNNGRIEENCWRWWKCKDNCVATDINHLKDKPQSAAQARNWICKAGIHRRRLSKHLWFSDPSSRCFIGFFDIWNVEPRLTTNRCLCDVSIGDNWSLRNTWWWKTTQIV